MKKVYCKSCGSLCKKILDVNINRYACDMCGFIYYKNPFPCVSVLVLDYKERILLGRRSTSSIYPDKWCLPCGYIEYDESYVQAAKREVKEETGIDIEPKGIINVVSNTLEGGVNSLVVVMMAEALTTDIVAGDDIVDVMWFDVKKKMPEMAFAADQYVIDEYIKTLEEHQKMNYILLHGNVFS